MAIHRGWGRSSTRVINCNSRFFLSLTGARCHFSDAHSIIHSAIYMRGCFYAILHQRFISHSQRPALPSIHLFPDWCKKTSPRVKLVYISNCTFFVFRCCVFTFLANTLACVPTSPIFIYKTVFFLCTLALDAFFHFFRCPRARLVDGEMVIRFGLVGCVLF